MKVFAGEFFDGKELIEGFAEFEDGSFTLFEGNPDSRPQREDVLIIPAPINMHTHIGDAFIGERNIDLPHDIMELVAPPNGLKHRLLRETEQDEVVGGMRRAVMSMDALGTSAFCDFREGGLPGVKMLLEAAEGSAVSPVILARPEISNFDEDELFEILKLADGIGASSISDWNPRELEEVSLYVNRKNGLFALHASERVREDLEEIIALEPDFLVHMTQGKKRDFRMLADEDISVAVCPRSNEFFGMRPRIGEMLDAEVNLMVGTDNAMLFTPNVIAEGAHLLSDYGVPLEAVLSMLCETSRKVLNSASLFKRPANGADYIVVERNLNSVILAP